MRRVVGWHDQRMDGLTDLVLRARGASVFDICSSDTMSDEGPCATVFDIGCNRGMVSLEMFQNGASLVHGCDNYEPGIAFARELFCDKRNVKARFEVVNLANGPAAISAAFGEDYPETYDIVLMLATYHKIQRLMSPSALHELMVHFAEKTGTYFGWRGRKEEMAEIDEHFKGKLIRIHTSHISNQMEPAAAIWRATHPRTVDGLGG